MKNVLKAVTQGVNPFDAMMMNWYELSAEDKDMVFDFFREAVAEEVGAGVYSRIRNEAGRLLIDNMYGDAVAEQRIDHEDAEDIEQANKKMLKRVELGEESHENYQASLTANQCVILYRVVKDEEDAREEEPYWMQERARLQDEV